MGALGVIVLFSSVLASQTAPPAEDLVVVVHPSSSITALDGAALAAIFRSSMARTTGGARIIAFNYAPRDPLRVEFDRVVLRLDPDQVSRFWIDARIRDGTHPPRQVTSPSVAVRVIARLEGAIGYVPASVVSHDVRVVARIRKGEVVPP